MKNHYVVKFKMGEVDENGFDNFHFMVTKRKFANAKEVRKTFLKPDKRGFSLFEDADIEDITPCSKDWRIK